MSDFVRYHHLGRYTENFSGWEWACSCKLCQRKVIGSGIPRIIVVWAQRARTHFGVPLGINSGYRCPFHNRNIGGSATSYHMNCAEDIGCPPTVAYEEFFAFFEAIPEITGLGKYPPGKRNGEFGFVHVDPRWVVPHTKRVIWER